MLRNNKILSFDKLKIQIAKLKKQKKNIVLCHGVFDLFHQGHIEHLVEAKKQGDILVVTLTSDQFVKKGPGRPLFNIKQRLEHLSCINIVDFVAENLWPTAIETIKILKPNLYVKGPDYKNEKEDETKNILREKLAVKKVNAKIFYTSGSILSSSNIINNNINFRNENEKKYLEKLKKKYSFKDIEKRIEKINKLKVLLIGDAIIDEYIFSEVTGKSSKDPVLVAKENNRVRYIGGILSMARLIGNFVKKTTLITTLGNNKNDLKFIKKNLGKKIDPKFIIKKNSPTVNKIRIIDEYSKKKLLGLYKYENKKHSKIENKKILEYFKNKKKDINQILVTDFGHGMINKELIQKISNFKIFKSLNAQLNSSNQSDFRFDKYKKTNLLILNIGELRRELREENQSIFYMAKKMRKKIQCNYMVVTLGNKGSYLINFKKNNIIFCPPFGRKVIDNIGAGDVMHSIISICLNSKIEEDLSLFISSVAAASSVENLGNSNIITKIGLLRSIKYLLK